MQPPTGLIAGGRFAEWRASTVALCVADVDGTLVGLDNLPSAATVEAVARMQATGVPVGLATGRMRLSAEPIATAIGASGPHVFHNGAEVRRDGKRLDAWPLSDAQVARILALSAHLDVYAEIYVDDGFVVTRDDDRALPHWNLLGSRPRRVVSTAGDVAGDALKATFAVFDDEARADAVAAEVERAGLRAGPSRSPITPGITYINVTRPDVDKGVAVVAAAVHAGATPASTAAIGDAGNDIPMLLVAGTAIAMGDAAPAVRAAAHLLAPDVTQDGAAVALAALVTH